MRGSIFLIAASVYIADRLTKILAMNYLFLGRPVEVMSGIFQLTLVLNKGTAFGLFKAYGGILALLSAVIAASILLYVWRREIRDVFLAVSLGLILGGAIGNLFDRIRFGCVIDFLDFLIWPVFNIADSAITVGTAILVWNVIIKQKVKGGAF